jgi:uncharacterized metal-binding protein YceD (DUF177 family)
LKAAQKYNINIVGLEDKQYVFEFEGDNGFFSALEQTLIEKGHFKATVTLDKTPTMIQTRFDLVGAVELTCDRSLEVFEEPFELSKRMIFKFGAQPGELTDEIEIIAWDTASIQVAPYIFDFIVLAMPVKRLHPKFRTESEDDDDEEGIMVYQTDAGSKATPTDDAPKPDEEKIDPRWEVLKKLKN